MMRHTSPQLYPNITIISLAYCHYSSATRRRIIQISRSYLLSNLWPIYIYDPIFSRAPPNIVLVFACAITRLISTPIATRTRRARANERPQRRFMFRPKY